MTSRARFPDRVGRLERDGVGIAWEVYGSGDPTILFVPSWSIVHSRLWKLQVPYFARHARVIVFDPRGNGRSDRPAALAAYAEAEFARDIVAVLDATDTSTAVLVSLSMGAQRSLLVAADHPDRVAGAVFIGPALPLGGLDPTRAAIDFDTPQAPDEGWARYNRHSWRRDFRGFLQFFFEQCLSEPHSTKPIEDCVTWGLETDPETLILTDEAEGIGDRTATLAVASRVRCPVLVIHGEADRIRPVRHGEELARATGGRLVTIAGGGHIPPARDPVKVNLLIREFLRTLARRDPVPPTSLPEVSHASATA